jgi:hypothetical protein
MSRNSNPFEESSFTAMFRHAAAEKNSQIIIGTSHERKIDWHLP